MAIDAEKKAKVLKYRWVVFVTLAIAYFFVYFHRTTGGAISGEMQDWFSITKSEVGMLASAYLWAYTLMQIPSGILTDKMGPRKAATIFILLLAAGSVLCAVSSLESIKSYPLMWVGKFVIGIGAAVIYIPIMKVLAVWFRKNEFASMSGILLLVGNVGGIAAATPMVMLIQNLGFADTYFILTGITVVIGILTWLFVRNHPNEMDRLRGDGRAYQRVHICEDGNERGTQAHIHKRKEVLAAGHMVLLHVWNHHALAGLSGRFVLQGYRWPSQRHICDVHHNGRCRYGRRMSVGRKAVR